MKRIFLLSLLIALMLPGFAKALQAPTLKYPKASDSPLWAGKIEFKWSSTQADYYKYHINLPSGESKEGISNMPSKVIYDLKLGNHSWAVASCNDSQGTDCSGFSGLESFTIESAPAQLLKGIVPCGRLYDNPESDIIESEPCQFTDIFVVVRYLLDFVLWRVGPIAISILILAVGAVSYFNVGSPDITVRIKAILRSALSGYVIILFAWFAVNIILAVAGYRIGVFGRWWELRF